MARLGAHAYGERRRIAAGKETAASTRTEFDVSGETAHAELLERAVTIAERHAVWSREIPAPGYTLKLWSTAPVPVPEHSTPEATTQVRLVGKRYVSGSINSKPFKASLYIQTVDNTGEVTTHEGEWVQFGSWARFFSDKGLEIAKGPGVVYVDEDLMVDGHPIDYRTALSGEPFDEVVGILNLIDES